MNDAAGRPSRGKLVLAHFLSIFAHIWWALVFLLLLLMQVEGRRTGALMNPMTPSYFPFAVLLLLPGIGAYHLARRIGGAYILTRSQILRISLKTTYLNSEGKRAPVKVFLYGLFPRTYFWLRNRDWVSELWITSPTGE
jgi:hypothetical protein